MFNQLGDRLKATFKTLTGKGRLTEANIADAMREVRIALLEADVSLEVTRSFISRVKAQAVGRDVLDSLTPGQAVIKIVQTALIELMGAANDGLNLAVRPPAVVMLAGLQGAGKTSTVGKLAKLLVERDKKKVLAVSVDVYRPAAILQLERLISETDAVFFAADADRQPVDIAADAVEFARRHGIDVVLVDTAGRLHVDQPMMAEIQRLHALLKPVETLFVVDSMSGQDAAVSARAFDQALPLSGIVLTKTDGDARGGAALSLREVTGKPIKFIGTGEHLDALEAFHPERVVSRILGMGDVLSLVEEVERKVDRQQAQKLADKLARGRGFNLEDFRAQMQQMEQMGGLETIMEKLPAMPGMAQRGRMPAADSTKKTAQTIAIINSMTPQERRFPALLRGARKRRIARGAGVEVQDVNRLLKQFMQLEKTMKRMKKQGGLRRMMERMPGGMPL